MVLYDSVEQVDSVCKDRHLLGLEQCRRNWRSCKSAGYIFERVHGCHRNDVVPSVSLSSTFRWSVDSDADDDSEY
jgi:hypothetical protein